MRQTISSFISKHESLYSLNLLRNQLRYRAGLVRHFSGVQAVKRDFDGWVRTLRRHVDDYVDYASRHGGTIEGARILEIGPGDSLGVALGLYANGAESVTCIDRFLSDEHDRGHEKLYRALIEQFDTAAQQRAEGAFTPDGSLDDQVIRRVNSAIETADTILPTESFDLIISRAVLEHVFDLQAAWNTMLRLLKPGGMMVHVVDMRNHGLYDQFHPLHWLTISDRLWPLLSSPDPTLNRELRPSYVQLIKSSNLQSEIYITHVIGKGELPSTVRSLDAVDFDDNSIGIIERMRLRMLPRYKDLDLEDLLVSAMIVVSTKPE